MKPRIRFIRSDGLQLDLKKNRAVELALIFNGHRGVWLLEFDYQVKPSIFAKHDFRIQATLLGICMVLDALYRADVVYRMPDTLALGSFRVG